MSGSSVKLLSTAPDEKKSPGHAKRGLSLARKTFLIVGGSTAALLLLFLWMLSIVLVEAFSRVQTELSEQRVKRSIYQVNLLAEELLSDVLDNAVWDETYAFLEGQNPEYLKRNYYESEGIPAECDLVAVLNANKELVQAFLPSLMDGPPNALPGGLDFASISDSDLFGEEGGAGIVLIEGAPFLLAAHPVLHTDTSGPSPGYLVYGEYLDAPLLDLVGGLSGGMIQVQSSGGRSERAHDWRRLEVETERFGAVEAMIEVPGRSFFAPAFIGAQIVVPTLAGEPVTFEMMMPETVFRQAINSRNLVIAASAAAGILMTALTLLVFNRLVLRRIAELARDMAKVSMDKSTPWRLPVAGHDEFARLGGQMNELLDRVDRSRTDLMAQRSLLSGVLQSVPEGVIALRHMAGAGDEEGEFEILLSNQAAEAMLGLSAETQAGMPLSSILHEAIRGSLLAACRRVMEAGKPAWIERKVNYRGCEEWFSFSIVRWGEGVVVSVSDVTERRRREAQIERNLEEIRRFNHAMLGRERRVLELKREVNDLSKKLGKGRVYLTDSDGEVHG